MKTRFTYKLCDNTEHITAYNAEKDTQEMLNAFKTSAVQPT